VAALSIERPGYYHPALDYNLYAQVADQVFTSPSTASDLTLVSDRFTDGRDNSSFTSGSSPRPNSRSSCGRSWTQPGPYGVSPTPAAVASWPAKGPLAMPTSDDGVSGTSNAYGEQRPTKPAAAASNNSRPKRVRTGCLTCRERHLKCDEAQPICQNCRKSNRTCRRGVRLNFIDTQVKQPPVVPISSDWTVNFLDESREIASEYVGGLGRYRALESRHSSTSSAYQNPNPSETLAYSNFSPPPAPQVSNQALPTMHDMIPPSFEDDLTLQNGHVSAGAYAASSASVYSATGQDSSANDRPKDYLDSQEEVLFMQVFVEEVGQWMDSLNPNKHVSNECGPFDDHLLT
jgi:hypothetical protein